MRFWKTLRCKGYNRCKQVGQKTQVSFSNKIPTQGTFGSPHPSAFGEEGRGVRVCGEFVSFSLFGKPSKE